MGAVRAHSSSSLFTYEGLTVKKLTISAIALAIGVAFSAGASAQNLSKDEYKAGKTDIAAGYKTAKTGCNSLAGNAKDICVADAKGKEKVARAELEARYKPGLKAQYNLRVAKADADYSVAREKCDDKDGNVKDVCVKEAKSIRTAAKADAKTQLKTADANKVANQKTVEARIKADKKSLDARQDAASGKRDADYAVAKEKCDAFAGDTKDRCITEAKARFGKS